MFVEKFVDTVQFGQRQIVDTFVKNEEIRKSINELIDAFVHRGDMISIMLGHHDEAFVGKDFHVLHPREELAEYMRLCAQYGVRPELEVWHTGSIWNLNHLIGKSLDINDHGGDVMSARFVGDIN